MELNEALEPLRRLVLEREVGDGSAAVAVEAARTALAGGADSPSLWELGALPEWDVLEARRLLAELEQELWSALRLPVTVEARDLALARYCLQDLLADRLAPLAAAERIGFDLRPADDPDSPLWPVRTWLHAMEDRPECCGGPSEEQLADLRDLAARLLAGPLA